MNWQNMSIGKKITIGFGTVLFLLVAVVIMGYLGVGGIVRNAEEVIDGNKLVRVRQMALRGGTKTGRSPGTGSGFFNKGN